MNRIIDAIIAALKKAGASDLFLGVFVVIEGLILLFARDVFPICVVLSIGIAFAFAIEWFVNVLRGEKSFWNVVQRIIIIILLIALVVYCFMMFTDEKFRLNVDRVLVAATTIADGLKNLVHTIQVEKEPRPRKIFITFSILYIVYGAAYFLLANGDINFFNTTMHGVVFILCGLTNMWLVYRGYESKKQRKARDASNLR